MTTAVKEDGGLTTADKGRGGGGHQMQTAKLLNCKPFRSTI